MRPKPLMPTRALIDAGLESRRSPCRPGSVAGVLGAGIRGSGGARASVMWCVTRAPSSKPSRTASAHARISSAGLVSANSSVELRQQPLQGAAGARCGRCGSRRGASSTSSRTALSIPSRISRTSSIGLPAGSGMSQASTVVGTYGQASPQPIVTAQSACSCISSVSLFGLRPARSMPTSRIASTTARPDLGRGFGAGGLGAHVLGAVALEERLGHLRAPGVVVADEQHVADRPLGRPRIGRWRVVGVHARIVLH